ncbi:hypothetical protein PVK06_009372 [Gossypium arboreum]|uniref:Uncharacterized protein n=1 Tax=Gossypium arboreum TaxID=29729 RepID=A0ABR0QN62_GOSAR|nr:hypothetical protein PVK06_009372 [Gossypium arboreum]
MGMDESNIRGGGTVDSRLFSTKKIYIVYDDSSYMLCHQQVLLALKIHKLQKFIYASTVPLPQYIIDVASVSKVNLDFKYFEQQDSALASWLLSSAIQSVILYLIGHDSTAKTSKH